MTAQPATTDPTDDRDIVTSLDCLGIWQADEAEIYENSGRTGLHRQILRAPNTGQWEDLVVRSVVSFPSAGSAAGFFADSSGRWSRCVNHRLNVAAGARAATGWMSGELTKTDTELIIPLTRQAGELVRQ